MSLPNRWIPPIGLLLLDATVDINLLYGEVPPVLVVLSIPGFVPHLRGLVPLRLIGRRRGRVERLWWYRGLGDCGNGRRPVWM